MFLRFIRVLGVCCALLAVLSVGGLRSAHAQAGGQVTAPAKWVGNTNAAGTPTGVVTIAAAQDFGTGFAGDNVGVDYGAMANMTIARFIPVLALTALFGTVVIASKGGVKMILGSLQRRFK